MELIHHHKMRTRHFQARNIENKTISLENLASKQKTFRIVKEHALPSRHRAITRAHLCIDGLASSRRNFQRVEYDRSGGASRDRTGDLLVANQTLSQLSYGPPPKHPRAHLPRGICRVSGGSGRSCTPDLTLIRGAL